MAKKYLSKGTTLAWMTGTPTPVFTTIAQRVSLEGPSAELAFAKTTDLDSTFVEKRPTIPDLGTMGGTLYFDPDDVNQAALRAQVTAPPAVAQQFKLVYPTGDTTLPCDVFNGYVKSFTPTNIEREGYLQAKFEIELTDVMTHTTGTP